MCKYNISEFLIIKSIQSYITSDVIMKTFKKSHLIY